MRAPTAYHPSPFRYSQSQQRPAMNLDAIPVGPNAPWDINVVIEIPQGGLPVKYEMAGSYTHLRDHETDYTSA